MNTETMELQKFNLAVSTSGDFDSDDLAEDLDGLRMDFPRVKIPGGGGLLFEIPSDDPENPDYVKNLEGVILYNHSTCAFWPGNDDDEDNNDPPLCFSFNGKIGIGEPGGTCSVCELNQFGTGEKGRGKACKNMRVLYLLRDGDFMPLQLSLPPTSLKPFSDFVNAAFAIRRRGLCGSLVQLGLKQVKNGSTTYSVATFKKVRDFEGPELAEIKKYADSFKTQIKEILRQRADEINQNEPVDDLYGDYSVAGEDLPFGVSDPHASKGINGDFEEIPA